VNAILILSNFKDEAGVINDCTRFLPNSGVMNGGGAWMKNKVLWCLYALINRPTSYSQKMYNDVQDFLCCSTTASRIFHESAHSLYGPHESRRRMKSNNPHFIFLQGPYELNNLNL
jgi:hypothetical protein